MKKYRDRVGCTDHCFDFNPLRVRIKSKYKNMKRFSEVLGCSYTIVRQKMCQASKFTVNEICQWAILLDIPFSQIGNYFFNINQIKESGQYEEFIQGVSSEYNYINGVRRKGKHESKRNDIYYP